MLRAFWLVYKQCKLSIAPVVIWTATRPHMFNSRKPLVDYSALNRAEFARHNSDKDDDGGGRDMTNKVGRKGKGQSGRRGGGGGGKVRIIKGRVRVRVAGYNNLQSISPAHLIRYIPATKVKVAAKRFLNQRDGGRKRGKRRGRGKPVVKRRKSKRRKTTR